MPVGSTNYPTTLDTSSTLVEARNNASTTLSVAIDSGTTAFIGANLTNFPPSGIIKIDDELISYSSITGSGNSSQFVVEARGFEGTTAAEHSIGAIINLNITAASNNVKSSAIVAVQTKLGTGSSTPTADNVLRSPSNGASGWGKITNSYIDASAAIDHSKLAPMSSGQILIGNNGVPTSTALSGDATISKSGIVSLATMGSGGIYTLVTVDSKGRVTSGTNPTTISGYGITDAYTKSETYSQSEINSFLEGLRPKKSVKAATTSNIDINSAVTTLDGISLVSGDRILVKDQTTASKNGIYKLNASRIPFRDSDMSTWDEVPSAYVFVEQGTLYGDVGFVCTSDFGGTIEASAIIWVQFTGATSINTGTGLTKSGNTLSIDSTVVTLSGSQTLSNKTITAPTIDSGIVFSGATSGTATLKSKAVAGTGTQFELPSLGGTLVGTGDSGSVTNTMLAGSIANNKLVNSTVTIGSTSIALGATSTSLSGLSSVSSTSFTGSLVGNSDTATRLATARTINGVSFDGTGNITVTTSGTGISVSGTAINIDSTVATLSGSQTLSNKTLSNVVFTGYIVSTDITGTTSSITGSVMYGTATGTRWSDRFFVVQPAAPATQDYTTVEIYAFSNTQAHNSTLSLNRAKGSNASPSGVSSGDSLGSITFNGRNSSGSYLTGATIVGVANGTYSTASPAYLDFIVNTTTANVTRGIRLDSSSLSPRLADISNMTLGNSGTPWYSAHFTSSINIGNGSFFASLQSSSLSANNTYYLPASAGVLIGNGDTATVTSGMIVSTLTSKQLGAANAGVATSCTVDGTNEVGFRAIPVSTRSTTATIGLSDAGKTIYCTASGITITIPANASISYPIGTALTFIHDGGAGDVSIACGDTMQLANSANTGTRTLARYGMATAIKVTATRWIISGAGLT